MTASERGTLWGVGLGPGDPELVTVKAARVIARGRRRRLPQRPARPQHRARHRRAVPAAGPDRGAPGLPGHHRDHRPSRRLRRRDGGLLPRGRRPHRRAPGRRPQRGPARRGRSAVLQLLHAHAHPADGAVRRRDRARGDVGERGVGGDRHPAGPGRRGADDPARHAARRRTQAQARRHRRRRGAEAGPIVSRCAGSAFVGRAAGRGVLRGARQHAAAAGAARRRGRRRQRAVLLARDAAWRRTPARAHRQRRRGRPRPGRHRLDDPAEPPRARRGHRPHRLRPLPRPRRDPRRSAPPPQRQHRRAGARPAGLHAGRAGPRRRGGVLRRPGRVRHGDRRAGGGQAVAGRARCG